jgi:hypothetical protein
LSRGQVETRSFGDFGQGCPLYEWCHRPNKD